MSNRNSIRYHRVGDYNIPNITLSPEEAHITLGKWGMLHKDYLIKNKRVLFTTLLVEGKLWQYLADIDTQAKQMFDTIVDRMKAAEGVTEQLKEVNQLEWIYGMQNIEARAREIVYSELIYK